ncbi:DIS3 mitotic control [Apophysomyces ossiformis]|uniref:DIS3-like exonuclease 1 n=1 Tax=Apophysomyces ossiformis TaxID=679940 RepID=A0A8H7BR77_9FUNG|nr:DIS3 mitotic control [Apophysomyces ossiformis]
MCILFFSLHFNEASQLQQYDKTRTYRKLRQIIDDSRRSSVIFYNEVFEETKVLRKSGETTAERDWRALCRLAEWYDEHLHQQRRIIMLSETFTTGPSERIRVYTTKQYLDEYWPQHQLLQNLVDVLSDVTIEEHMEWIQMRGKKSLAATPVSGYTEQSKYKSMEELEVGIKSSRYFAGILRCRSDSRDQAYVSSSGQLDKDILIVGNENRNRAVQGDMVVVELLSESRWVAPSNEISYNNMSIDDESQQLQTLKDTQTARPTGRVVGVLNRNWRSYVATIQEEGVEGGSFHLAIPLDPTIPKIRIRHQEVKLIQNQRIVVRIDHWPVSSQYPNGHFVRSLGPIHQLDTEISAILVEHGISVSQASQGFSAASLKEMPIDTLECPWRPDKSELARRKDLRSLTVFSIDPPNCQDIDDALSVRELKNGNIELGVHIADVSYFVKENSLTDLEARARGTTVYLADRRFDMLPSVLSERVCSLRENVDRYAVSVIWSLDKAYNILDTWFGRTIIRSSCEMEYEQAQQLLDGKPVATGLDTALGNRLRSHVQKLAEVLRHMRNNRLAKGALELESTEVKFKIAENNQITDINILFQNIFDHDISEIAIYSMEIHGLVAEAMILANAYVGKRIYDGIKDAAVLRRHPPPNASQFERLIQAAKSRGFMIDFSSNRALAQSLDMIVKGSKDDPEIAKLIKSMATVAMNEAGYISSGHYSVEQYRHYGLALDYYTHFTSPIRRYADVVAHRQLLLCVQDEVMLADNARGSVMTSDAKITEICENLNRKSRESKFAQKTVENSLIESGVISEVRSNGFYVFVPRLGLKGPVFLVDKDGHPTVPLSLVSGQSSEGDLGLPLSF